MQERTVKILIMFAVSLSLFNFYPIQSKLQNSAIDIAINNHFFLEVQRSTYNVFTGSNYDLLEFEERIVDRKSMSLGNYYAVGGSLSDGSLERIKNDGAILSIGINPMVLAWNGWSVFNGYVFNYPLQHKKDFILIVEEKMNQNPEYRKYIQEWGNRLILNLDRKDYSLDGINLCKAKSFDVDYLLSDKPLSINKEIDLYATFGEVYVYRITC
jgi:hypothetical protein